MKGKHLKKTKFSTSKIVVLSLALSLLLCAVVGSTVAWLVANTDPVINTFTYGDINITLEETDTNKDGDNNPNTNNYPMLPGNPIKKDPKITFLANSENAWLFVKLEETANFDDFMTYEVADGWTALDNVDGVYYREAVKSDTDAVFNVLKEDAEQNTVFVKDEVTKEMLNALDSGVTSSYPTLTVTAYAVQRDSNITTATDAWAKIPSNTNP